VSLQKKRRVMSTKTNWDARFRAIDLAIDSKDFEGAKELIDETITDAHVALIDPTFLVRELHRQRKKLENSLD
jgi:hypothetical protein